MLFERLVYANLKGLEYRCNDSSVLLHWSIFLHVTGISLKKYPTTVTCFLIIKCTRRLLICTFTHSVASDNCCIERRIVFWKNFLYMYGRIYNTVQTLSAWWHIHVFSESAYNMSSSVSSHSVVGIVDSASISKSMGVWSVYCILIPIKNYWELWEISFVLIIFLWNSATCSWVCGCRWHMWYIFCWITHQITQPSMVCFKDIWRCFSIFIPFDCTIFVGIPNICWHSFRM